ncbi:unnamed protein product [Orchesella dallaii]|uniref:Uncharacterized protein n=1 Tax=Orchesella dallaii TaxID=48710 RepID=A0ABP1QA71_9HEXA
MVDREHGTSKFLCKIPPRSFPTALERKMYFMCGYVKRRRKVKRTRLSECTTSGVLPIYRPPSYLCSFTVDSETQWCIRRRTYFLLSRSRLETDSRRLSFCVCVLVDDDHDGDYKYVAYIS